MMKLSEFDYELPQELIAQFPAEKRDESKLLVFHRDTKNIEHRIFKDIENYLRKGDCLVINDTKVIPARLFGIREDTGGKIEFVLLNSKGLNKWEVLVKPGKRAKLGTTFIFGDGILKAKILDKTDVGGRLVQFEFQGVFEEILDKVGNIPLPPYIHESIIDTQRYQTVYAESSGSAAAPTAGLHFTPELLNRIKELGIKIVSITLHVGLGTFRPVKVEDIQQHNMHSEMYNISEDAAKLINRTKENGGRIIAVGTTSARTLESTADISGKVHSGNGWTDIFIYPGYRFKVIDALITNFHLPKSTLIMLVSAFAGRNEILNAYNEAVMCKYRFFSFGDAMLII